VKRDAREGVRAPAVPGLLLLAALLALSLHAASYLPFISDDALISLRYAERLLEGEGLTWTDGERVEGYSNLLWILLCAALGVTGIDLIAAARVLGLTGAAATLLLVARAAARGHAGSRLPGVAAALALAACGPLAVWAVGGLEQPLLAALLAWALAAASGALDGATDATRATWHASIPLALLCWTRPDGALFTAAICAGFWLAACGPRRRRTVACARLALLPAAAYLAQSAFRIVYYGDGLPNPAYAKLAFTLQRFGEGANYVASGAFWLAGLLLPSVWLGLQAWRAGGPAASAAPAGFASTAASASSAEGHVAKPRTRGRLLLLSVPIVFWAGYVALIGGDGFPGRRHWVPLLIPLALIFAEGLAWLSRRGARRTALVTALSGVLLLAGMQSFDPQNRRARLERWEWDGAVVGRFLREAFHEQQPLLAVDPAGTLPYFSRLPALDMLGINDRYLAHHRPADFGHGPLGHELGDGSYVLDREPDLVAFCGPTGAARPCFRGGKEMVRDARFRASYRLVQIVAGESELAARLWVRAEGGRLGIRREERRVRLPALLLSANPESTARLAADGTVGVAVQARVPAGYAALRLSPGAWRLRVEHDGSTPRTTVRRSGEGVILARGGSDLGFLLESGDRAVIDLQIDASPAAPTRVRYIDLVRAPEGVIN